MRNGSGSYSLPVNSWNPATNGVSATAADWQSLIDDVETALTASVAADGQTPITGNLAMGGNKLTGLGAGTATGNSARWEQLFSQGVEADIASATTTDIGGQNTNFLQITGTTTITSLGTSYNGPRFLRFSGVLTLTNGSALILPGGANITTAAGDRAIAIPKASAGTADGWVVWYQRAAGAVTTSGLTMATARILGRTTGGTGAIEELTAANVAAFTAAASDTAQGAVELATTAEVQTGTDTGRVPSVASFRNGSVVSYGQQTAGASAVNFTSIPSWAKKITVQLDGISTNGTAITVLQIGDAGGLENSEYVAAAAGANNGNPVVGLSSTSGFPITPSGVTTYIITGTITLTLMDAATFKWIASGSLVQTGGGVAGGWVVAGSKSLSQALDRLSLVTTDAFDAGSVNVLYE
jgi:hypothetical protein